MSIIDTSSGYHNLKLDMQLSYLTTFSCPFGRYCYKCILFEAAPVGNMFQRKINEIFNDIPNVFGIAIPNVFGIADDILVIEYNKDWTDHDEVVYSVLRWCCDVSLKLNKDKCHCRCTSIPFFGKVVSRGGVQPDPQKVKALTKMLVSKNKREFSPGTMDVCNPLHKLTSSRTVWMWNASYQQLFSKAKLLIKVGVCMKFYDDTKPLYLETDASGVGLEAALLQLHNNTTCQKGMAPDSTILWPIAFANKSLTGAEWRYSNIK